jgi:hypothetical protein
MASTEREAHKFDETASVYEVDIAVENNTIIVGTNGGNITGAPGDKIIWRATASTPPFSLAFFQLAAEPAVKLGARASARARAGAAKGHTDVATLQRWPFVEPPEPPGGITAPTRFFCATLSGNFEPPTPFKYSLIVGNLQLDPIIIIDR